MTRPAHRATAVLGLSAAVSLLLAGPATAHTTANPSSTVAGSYSVITMRVPHGCEGAATAKLEVGIPDGVVSVTPEQVPGWEATTEVGPYDEPVEVHGSQLTEGVRVVTWTADEGQELPDDRYRDFGLSVKLPDAEGETLAFPAVQTCVDGSEAAWIETSDDPDAELDHPAPTVTLTAASAAATDGGTSPLVHVALVVGVLGLVSGLLGRRAALGTRASTSDREPVQGAHARG